MYKEDLALNNTHWLICRKIPPTNYPTYQTGTTTLDQRGPENHVNEGLVYIPQTPILEPHYQMVQCHIEGN